MFTKKRLQKLAGIIKEGKSSTLREEVDFPEDYSELQDWLDERPGTSAHVEKLVNEEGARAAAEWMLSNFDNELRSWPGNELLSFLSTYTRNSNDDDYYDDSMDGDFDSGMASAGFGTDEDYGSFGGDEW